MRNDEDQFVELRQLTTAQEVTLGDGCSLEGTAEGTVVLYRNSGARRKYDKVQTAQCPLCPKALIQPA